MEADLIKLIKRVCRQELAQTLMGLNAGTDNSQTTSVIRFATDSQIQSLRLIRPYGVASRPPVQTPTVVHPINADPTHLISLGDYDLNRPILNEGETNLYAQPGQSVYLDSLGNVNISTNTTSIEVSPDGTIRLTNPHGSIVIESNGDINITGPNVDIGENPSQGCGLGNNIESRLTALETAVTGIASNLSSHVHPLSGVLPGFTGPETPTQSPFTANPLPAASTTVTVAT